MHGVAEVLIVDAIAPVGPQPDSVDRVAPVGTHVDAEAPVGMIGSFIDQAIGGLVGAELVVVDLLVVIDFEQRIGASRGFRIAAVEESCAVVRPCRARELDPFQMIRLILPSRDIAHAEFLPVRAAPRRAVDHRLAVFGEREDRKRDSAVR